MNNLKQLETERNLLHRAISRLAYDHYLRKGYISIELKNALNATSSLRALEKYNPNWGSQPRVPSGNSNGGQWTSGGGSSGGTTTTKPKTPKKPASSFSIPDAIWHYFTGNGQDVTVAFNEVDVGLQPHNFPKYKRLVQSMNKRQGSLEVDEKLSKDIGGQYGHINFRLFGYITSTPRDWKFEGYVGAYSDWFDFDEKPEGTREYWKEKITQLIGFIPGGTKYEILFPGRRNVRDGGTW